MPHENTAPKESIALTNSLVKINRFLDRIFPLLVTLGVILGVSFQGFFSHLRVYVPFLFGLVTLSGALKLKIRELGATVSSPRPLIAYLLFSRILVPVMVFALSRLVFGNADVVTGFVLLYAIPTAVTSFIWVTVYGGNAALALTLILLDTVLAPLISPATVRFLLGSAVTLDMSGMIVSLFLMVVVPTIIGVTLNETSKGKIPTVIAPFVAPLSKLTMVVVIASNTSAVASQLRLNNPFLWKVSSVCVAFIVVNFILARTAARTAKLDRGQMVSFLFTSCLRNSAAAMTLAIRYFPEYAALPAVLGIVLQHNTSAVMGRIFFGKIGSGETKAR